MGEAKAAPPLARLIVVNGGSTSYQEGHSFPVYATTTIGRGPDNSLILSDGFVSSSHATITFRDGGWWLSDLDSRNGTWLNGERISREVQVRSGDLLAIGQVKLKLAK